MELITIRQVSQDYGISRQMLCYYEEIGLIKSSRKDDYAYRVYDEEAIKRLQQIIILRKLQIPMKQIKDILNNQNAITVIEIFKQNISELDEEITALSSVKSILARFVEELQQKTDVYLKLDLLNDKTMINLVDSLSFTKHKIKENVSMEELNKAAEQMIKLNDKDVRVVYLPPSMVACAYDPDDNPDHDEGKKEEYEGRATLSILQKFINDVDLFGIKPDAKVYGWGDTMNGKRVYMMWVTIPDDIDVPAPLWKEKFSGGLYAKTSSASVNLGEWMEKNGYEWNRIGKHNQFMTELVNPVSIFDTNNTNSEKTGFIYTDSLMPIRKIKQWSDDSIGTALAELDELFSSGKTTEINLSAMVKRGDFEMSYKNGFMVIKKKDYVVGEGMATPQQFNVPLKIELRAKTDSTDICIGFAQGGLCFQDFNLRDKIIATDIIASKDYFHSALKEIPIDEFVDIEWIIGNEIMAIKVNGELWRIGDDYSYIEALRESPELNISSPVTVSTLFDATVTVGSLRVTEI